MDSNPVFYSDADPQHSQKKSRFLFGCGSATLAKKIPFFIRMRIRNTGKEKLAA
jgi:hypothetical protein